MSCPSGLVNLADLEAFYTCAGTGRGHKIATDSVVTSPGKERPRPITVQTSGL